MLPDRKFLRQLLRETLIGAVLGLVILGAGGRLVMRLIAEQSGAPAILTVGGTITVVAAGLMAGAGGALLHAIVRSITRRFAPGYTWPRMTLFGLLLALVTMRGLRGSPAQGAVWFWPLVGVYWAAFLSAIRHFALGFRRRIPGGRLVLFEFPMHTTSSSDTPALTIRGSRAAVEAFIPRDEFGTLFGGFALWDLPAEPTEVMPDEAIGVWSRRMCSRFRRVLRERGADIEVREERGPEQRIRQLATSRDTLSHRDKRRIFAPRGED
jgi:hypothetical protein